MTTAVAPATELLDPAVAVLNAKLTGCIKRVARELIPKDKSLRDDLTQEGLVAILICKQPKTFSEFLTLATWRMKDYLKTENKHQHEVLDAQADTHHPWSKEMQVSLKLNEYEK